jgi:hypothetical protein
MMKISLSRPNSVLLLALMSAASAAGQKWEVGAGGGASFYTDKTVSNRSGTAETGFKSGYTAVLWLGQNNFKHVGGEVRYHLSKNDLKLSSGGTSVGFSAQAHTVGYNVLVHTAPTGSKIRPYILVGGGVKIYRGRGEPRAVQPLSQFAILTRTDQVKPYVQIGAGVKAQISNRVFVRAEFSDQLSPFPDDVILPVPSGSVGGWFHNFLPVFGIGFTF